MLNQRSRLLANQQGQIRHGSHFLARHLEEMAASPESQGRKQRTANPVMQMKRRLSKGNRRVPENQRWQRAPKVAHCWSRISLVVMLLGGPMGTKKLDQKPLGSKQVLEECHLEAAKQRAHFDIIAHPHPKLPTSKLKSKTTDYVSTLGFCTGPCGCGHLKSNCLFNPPFPKLTTLVFSKPILLRLCSWQFFLLLIPLSELVPTAVCKTKQSHHLTCTHQWFL